MDDSFTFVQNVKMIQREELDFCNGFDAFPWPLSLGRGGAVQLSLHSCAQLSDGSRSDGIEGTPALRQLWATGSCFSSLSLCCGWCSWLSPVSSRTERWGFPFFPPTWSPPAALLWWTNVLLVLCTRCWCTNPAPCVAFKMGICVKS